VSSTRFRDVARSRAILQAAQRSQPPVLTSPLLAPALPPLFHDFIYSQYL
jgi:hypothetical protein